MKMLGVSDFGAESDLSWHFGDNSQYPAVRTYAVNPSDEQVQGYVLCDQPMPRPECVPLVSIAAVSSGVDEGNPAVFTLTRTRPPTAELIITVAVTGDTGFASATPPTTATFAANEKATTLSIATGNDMDEEDGVIMVTVSSTATYRVDKDAASAEVAVADDDLPEVSISGGVTVTEGMAAVFTVSREGVTTQALTVMVAVTQTGDFLTSTTSPVSVEIMAGQATATLSVNTDDDMPDEPDGMITATIIASASTYRLGTATATVDVMDNDVVASRSRGPQRHPRPTPQV